MAFCTKNASQTGEYSVSKTFTPSSQNYVYVVTLKPSCKVFDFRNHDSLEFKDIYKIIDKDIVAWIEENAKQVFDMNDIYEFVAALETFVIKPIDKSGANYLRYCKLYDDANMQMPPNMFLKACNFTRKNGLLGSYETADIHQIMAPILKGLHKLGYHGILTREQDFNDETMPSTKVTTDYAIGIFDKNCLDLLSIVPMKYEWLKQVNPSYLSNKTDDSAYVAIKKLIDEYKNTSQDAFNESFCLKTNVWYFGNNRSKSLKMQMPGWSHPLFLTSSYSYAEDYADYGVYKIQLVDEKDINILDFNNTEDVAKLRWPKIVVDAVKNGRNDLNSIAYDMYALLHGRQLTYISQSKEWLDAARYFDEKSKDIMSFKQLRSQWGTEKDHQFLLQMWKDIYDAGFDGFTHIEFGRQVLALFKIDDIDHTYVSLAKRPISENKETYMQKFKDQPNAKDIVEKFWQLKKRLKYPQNDIDWWIKKPFSELEAFVNNFDTRNKQERRDNNYKVQAMQNDAKMLGEKDGYEIWYVPTYEAMRILGRFYKGISTQWCVASDDPSFWFDNHDQSEFIVLVRKDLQHDEFDKIALEMQNGGNYFDIDDFKMWDVENEDDRFCNDELMHHAWQLFKHNGERRQGL